MNDHGNSPITTSTKIVAFIMIVSGLVGGGVLLGEALGVEAPAGHEEERQEGHGGVGPRGHAGNREADPVRGLAVAESGLRLVLERSRFAEGPRQELSFRVVDGEGRAVRDFEVEHEKRMHLIVVRRDMHAFQHLHPALGEDGQWSIPLALAEPGSYRVFADFKRDGRNMTLASDLAVDGPTSWEEIPAPAETARASGGYEVRLSSGRSRAAAESELRFEVTRDGRPVEVDPYLGARGHLVALREGDLAYLHVHPVEGEATGGADEHGGDEGGHGAQPEGDHGGGPAGADGPIAFATEFPTDGRYRLFLQFQVDGNVQTAAFTREVSR